MKSKTATLESVQEPPIQNGFAALGIGQGLLRSLLDLGITDPTDIQSGMIPHILAGRDVVGQARTGTGKTIAFALPLVQRVNIEGDLQVLILVPTRELCTQVAEELKAISKHTRIRSTAIYGGTRSGKHLDALAKRPHVVVGTPGRVIDFLERGKLRFEALTAAVLDEVDRMLDIGFRDDIKRILSRIRQPHQTIVVSATIDPPIRRLIDAYANDPVEVNVSRDELTVPDIEQWYIPASRPDKLHVLRRLIELEQPELMIVFSNTRHGARRLGERLRKDGARVGELHGDLEQRQREKVLASFKSQDLHVLVATDVAARGLHVDNISHIINFDVPEDPQVYVHRIGRTGRMGSGGTAISLVTPEEGKQLTSIEMLINRELKRYEVPGYTPSIVTAPPPQAPPPQAPEARGPVVPDRYVVPLFLAPDSNALAPGSGTYVRPRTLGSKFRPSRSRRV